MIKNTYDSLGIKHRFGNLKMTMFSTKGGCKLKGTAAEVRAMGAVIHVIWKSHMNASLDLHNKIELCLRLSCHMEKILDDHPEEFVLPGFRL